MTAAETSYSADDFAVLEGLQAVQKRPGMYIGSTDSRGLLHLVQEIVSNSVDEALAGFCKRIDVTLHPDGSVEVLDDGRGIPTGIHSKTAKNAVYLAVGVLHAGGKFSNKSYNASGGLHGVGSASVNALSKRFDVTVWRDGKVHEMSFKAGKPGVFAGDGPNAKFAPSEDLRVIGKAPRGRTGTSIRYWVDSAYFEPDAALVVDDLVARLRNTAFLVKGLKLVLHDTRNGKIETVEFDYPDWLAGMVEFCAPAGGKPVSDTLTFVGEGQYKENAPDENGVMRTGVERTCQVQVALQWGSGYETRVEAFTNVIANRDGGSHINGFERAVGKTLIDAIQQTRGLLKPREQAPTLSDVLEGVTAVVHVKVPEPKFTSQTKDRLSTTGVTKAVEQVVSQGLKAWLADRKTKAQAKLVLDKIVAASRVRLEETAQKDRARKKNAAEGSNGLPAKLADCANAGDPRSELFLVEGNSAAGSAKTGRSAKYQAILPLRGKVLNTQEKSLSQALTNAEIDSIISAVGAGAGREFNVERMRYGRIMIMADADVDGGHIRALLLTFLAKFMRPAVEAGRVFSAVPPLFVVTTTGRNPERMLCYTKADLDRTLAQLEKAGKTWRTPIERNKGLGEMNAAELWATTMDPTVRTVRRITIDDVTEAEATLDLLMGGKADARKAWMTEYAAQIDQDDLDI